MMEVMMERMVEMEGVEGLEREEVEGESGGVVLGVHLTTRCD